jgi:methionyl-tRNA formyltransferase
MSSSHSVSVALTENPNVTRLKLGFLTQDDPLYILPFFEEFLRHYAHRFQVDTIYACRTMGKRSRLQLLRELYWLYGAGILRLIARVLSAKILAVLPASRRKQRFHSLSQLCHAFGIRYMPTGNPNSREFVGEFREHPPDLLVSVACPYILKSDVLSVPKLGGINIHNAPLPRYKGMMPVFWQMFHGETSVGFTVHKMAAKVDEGDSVLQDSLEIRPGESLHALMRRCKRHAAHCVAEAVEQIATGAAKVQSFAKDPGTYFTVPTRQQIDEFHRRGYQAI